MGRKGSSTDSQETTPYSSEASENFSEEGEEEEQLSNNSDEEEDNESESTSQISTPDVSEDVNQEEKRPPVIVERLIITPHWATTKKKDPTNLGNEYKDYDILRKHQRLALLERRINLGEDHVHLHPGLVPDLENEKEDLNCTEIEVEEVGDFRTHQEETIIPSWWPRRCYDQEKDILDKKESEELLEKIQNSTKRRYGLNYTRSHRVTDQDSEKNNKFKRKFVLTYSVLDYETDKSDELTDWDEAIELF